MTKYRSLVIIGILLCLATSAFARELRYPPARWVADNDRVPFLLPPPPRQDDLNGLIRAPYNPLESFLRDAGQDLQTYITMASSVSRVSTQHLPGLHAEADDTNNFDEVADSTWFTNRIGRAGVRAEELEAQVTRCRSAFPSSATIIAAGVGRERPSLLIEDQHGIRFAIHPDPIKAPGSVSAPATAAALILWAAGYPVTDTCRISFDRSKATVDAKAVLVGEYGKKTPLTATELNLLFKEFPSTMSAVAMRIPDGLIFGPSSFTGERFGDRNERLRRQDRRELRGLRTFSAFIGWVTISERSWLDVFSTAQPEPGFFTHHLFNLTEIATPGEASASGLGASQLNAAFSATTPLDAFWAANLISRFDDSLIHTIIEAAHFASPTDAATAEEGLKKRRDVIVKAWFSKISPLTDFALRSEGNAFSVSCTDRMVTTSTPATNDQQYRYQLTTAYDRKVLIPWQDAARCEANLPEPILQELRGHATYELTIEQKSAHQRWWRPGVKAYLERKPEGVVLAGIARKMH